ncbi:MAG: cytochrome c biogenesis protein CcdA [Nitrospirae bacterium]|nr:MAG: cytochrome c biogenesis protein CcdA [Nitrospirota bacterium]
MMELGITNMALAFGAGLASVLSPCVLPVIPVIVAGAEYKDRLRPLIVVFGLSLTFMAMGAISSLFGSMLIGKTRYIEQAGGIVIMCLGAVVFFDISIFKKLYRLSNIQVNSEGRLGGLILGMALGVVWIPCVGPMLSGILVMVGTSGQLVTGVLLLGIYSLGLAVPMLVIAYSSSFVQKKLSLLSGSGALRYVMGGILIAFGFYVTVVGNFAF